MTDIPKLAEIAALKTTLITFPDLLYAARRALAAAQQTAATLKEELDQAEAETLLLVGSEVKPDGKPLYSNEASRSAEVRRRLCADGGHQKLAGQLTDAENERIQAEMEVRRREDEQRAWRAVTDLTMSEVQLLVAGR